MPKNKSRRKKKGQNKNQPIDNKETSENIQTDTAEEVVNEEKTSVLVTDGDVVENNIVVQDVKTDENKETPNLKQEEQSVVINVEEGKDKEEATEPNNIPTSDTLLKAEEESLNINDDTSDLNESDSNSKTAEKKKKLFSFSLKKKKKEKERSSSLLDVNADELEMSDDKKETQNATVQRAQSMSHFDREPKSKSKIPLHKFRTGKKKNELAASTSNVDSTSLVLNPGMDDWRMSGLLGTMESSDTVNLQFLSLSKCPDWLKGCA